MNMRIVPALMLAGALTLAGCQDPAATSQGSSRDEIRIVGSSTVFPFAKAVAEQFVNADPSRPSPILESTGTGGGMELFCAGMGANTPDIANASRRIKPAEFERCQKNGVTDIIELQIGFDGIAIAQSVKGPQLSLSTTDLYRVLAAKPFGAGSNTISNWSDLGAGKPAVKVNIFGPPSTSGTRDALEELIMEKGCKTDPAMAKLADADKDAFETNCHTIRSDGAYVDTGENDNLIVQKLGANPNSVGIFSYSYLESNADTIRGIPINGIAPTYATIENGSYPGARVLYIYVKKAHLGVIPGLGDYVEEFLGADSRNSYLVKEGLISLPDATRTAMAKRFADKQTLSASELN